MTTTKPKKILLTKLASMGDLVHLLPALTDAKRAYPECSFDWVIDKNFQEIARWHPAVDRLILTEHRKWRKSLFAKETRKAIKSLIVDLQKEPYDLVIDAQGNFKSALIAHLAQSGSVVGWDGRSIPEWGAHFLYKNSFFCKKSGHAIDRLRQLVAQSLGYSLPSTPPDYGILLRELPPILLDKDTKTLPPIFFLFVTIASTKEKLWPESYWRELLLKMDSLKIPILLPWGSPIEYEQVKRLAENFSWVHVLPKLSLSQLASLIKQAKGVVSLDTGLSHIAAALSTPNLSLYGPTDPKRTGTTGKNQYWITALDKQMTSVLPQEVFSCLSRHFLDL